MKKTAAILAAAAVLALPVLTAAPALASSAQRRPAVVIRKIFYNSPGRDDRSNASLNAEWVKLHNRSGHRVTLTGWTLRDRSGHVYTFGTYRLAAHSYVKIHTGRGHNTQANRFQRRDAYVWNNDGDRATLRNANGVFKSRCSYSDPNEVNDVKVC
jgi:hypothetical protein